MTERGCELSAWCDGEDAAASRRLESVPFWDHENRQLWYANRMVREFHPSAFNLMLLLRAFQEDGWPPKIDDPLERSTSKDRSGRLRKAIEGLNKAQRTLRFWADGTGESIRWEPRSPK